MNSIFRELETIAPLNRHWAYAVNCYQHASGYEKPIVTSIVLDPQNRFTLVDYAVLGPGTSAEKLANNKELDDASFRRVIETGCLEDSLLDRGMDATVTDNCTRLALYFNEQNPDYHFVRQREDGIWEDKVPFRGTNEYTALPPTIDEYKFVKFYDRPDGSVPRELQRLAVKERSMIVGKHVVLFDQAHVEKSAKFQGNRVLYDHARKLGMAMSTKLVIPYPALAWPMRNIQP